MIETEPNAWEEDMTDTQEVLLIESSIGQVERVCSHFARNFVIEIDEVASIVPSQACANVSIDPLQFLLSACDRFKQIEAFDETSIAPGLLPDREQFNLAANAMLRALAKTLGPDLSEGARDAWINVLRTVAGRGPAAARASEVA